MRLSDRVFHAACALCMAVPLALVVWFVENTLVKAGPGLSDPTLRAEVFHALVGGLRIVGLALLLVLPPSLAVAVHLEQRVSKGIFARIIERSLSLLASVPSILYGVFALAFFWNLLGIRSTLALGSLTLALLLFPMLVQRSRDALRSVPATLHEAALALGADDFRALVHVVLPMAFPKLVAGALVAAARALGTAAPLLVLVRHWPHRPVDGEWGLPLWIFEYANATYPTESSVAVIVLLAFVVALQALGNWLSARHDRTIRRQGLSERGLA